MHPLKKLLVRIPDRRVRRVASFLIAFAISLLIGRIAEQLLSKEALQAAHDAQTAFIKRIEAFTPLELVKGYWTDIDAVSHGELLYKAPPKPAAIDPAEMAAMREAGAKRLKCDMALGSALATPPDCAAVAQKDGVSAALCSGADAPIACAAYKACTVRAHNALGLPPDCIGIDTRPYSLQAMTQLAATGPLLAPQTSHRFTLHPIFIPVIALAHGATRLASGGIGGAIVALIQLGFGFAAFAMISSALSSRKEMGFGSGLANLTLGPVAVVALGSLLALALQGLMLGALFAFSWITGLAASAAAGVGLAGGCWYCITELTKKGVEHTVVG